MKIFTLICLVIFSSLNATVIKSPVSTLIASGNVIDLVYKDSKIYIATDAGVVDIFDLDTKKIIQKISVPKIKDFMGDEVNAKVFSVDEFDGYIMILSQSKKGFSRLHVNKNSKNRLLIDHDRQLSIIKAKYIDKNHIVLALLSNEILIYDIINDKIEYTTQVSGAKFSDFSLNKDRTKIAVTDESGEVNILQTSDTKVIKTFSGENLDNVFQLSFKNGIIATAGQDRRVAIYNTNKSSAYHIKSSFLVYSVGLSPSGKIVGYSSDEKNNVSLFNTITKKNIGIFGGNPITLSNIIFIDETSFLVSSNSKIINLYTVK